MGQASRGETEQHGASPNDVVSALDLAVMGPSFPKLERVVSTSQTAILVSLAVVIFPPMDKRVQVRKAVESDLLRVVGRFRQKADRPWGPFSSVERLKAIPQEGLLVAEADGAYAGFVYWFEGRLLITCNQRLLEAPA